MNAIQEHHITTGSRCIICNSPQLKKIIVNSSFGINIVECDSCHFVQSEYVSEKALKAYYENFYLNLNEQGINGYKLQQSQQGESQLNYIQEICENQKFKIVLDYGASLGGLAEKLRTISEQVYVIEANPKFTDILKQSGMFSVLNENDLFDTQFEDFFDLVTISHVLEHIQDPLSLLDNFNNILKEGGYLMVDLPNEVQMLKEYGFQASGHLHYFTINSFQEVIKKHGTFEIVEIRTCNRTVEEFIASGYTLPEDYSRAKSENGTVIRAMLRNNRKNGFSAKSVQKYVNEKVLLDDFSQRILFLYTNLKLMHQAYLKAQDEIKQLKNYIPNVTK